MVQFFRVESVGKMKGDKIRGRNTEKADALAQCINLGDGCVGYRCKSEGMKCQMFSAIEEYNTAKDYYTSYAKSE